VGVVASEGRLSQDKHFPFFLFINLSSFDFARSTVNSSKKHREEGEERVKSMQVTTRVDTVLHKVPLGACQLRGLSTDPKQSPSLLPFQGKKASARTDWITGNNKYSY